MGNDLDRSVFLINVHSYISQGLVWGGQHSILRVRAECDKALGIWTGFYGVNQPEIVKVIDEGALLKDYNDPKYGFVRF
jgi:hypothetical protein